MKGRVSLLVVCSVLLSACGGVRTQVMPAPEPTIPAPSPARGLPAACPECGRIERIEVLQGLRATPRGGAVLGGVVGGVLANPQRQGAPAASRASQTMYRITLRMADGSRRVLNQDSLPFGLKAGSPVIVRDWRVIPLHL